MTPISLPEMYKWCLVWILSKLLCLKFLFLASYIVRLAFSFLTFIKIYSQSPLLIITDSLLCPQERKPQHFLYTSLIRTLFMAPSMPVLAGFDPVITSFHFSGHWFLALIYNLPFLVGKARMDKNSSRRCVVELLVDD